MLRDKTLSPFNPPNRGLNQHQYRKKEGGFELKGVAASSTREGPRLKSPQSEDDVIRILWARQTPLVSFRIRYVAGKRSSDVCHLAQHSLFPWALIHPSMGSLWLLAFSRGGAGGGCSSLASLPRHWFVFFWLLLLHGQGWGLRWCSFLHCGEKAARRQCSYKEEEGKHAGMHSGAEVWWVHWVSWCYYPSTYPSRIPSPPLYFVSTFVPCAQRSSISFLPSHHVSICMDVCVCTLQWIFMWLSTRILVKKLQLWFLLAGPVCELHLV